MLPEMTLPATTSEKHGMPPLLAILVPAYNENAVINRTIDSLSTVLEEMRNQELVQEASFIFFVDDGSSDATWRSLVDAHAGNPAVKGLRLSRNFGHQNALLAGLLTVRNHVDCVISIDADLQQDEKAIPEFIKKYNEGADIVFGIRRDRMADSYIKRQTASWFYRLMKIFGANIIEHHADYRLMSRKALDVLAEYGEINLFLRGIVTDIGLRTDRVFFDVTERRLGETKYSLVRMVAFALKGITSFSVTPLRLVTLMGFVVFLASLMMTGYILFQKFVTGLAVPGWASTVIPVYFIGGIQILCIGVIGEYLGNIYKEVKARPRYIIEEKLD